MAAKSGLRLVQLLPVNDTSVNGNWWDSYPYSSLSVFALHPLYLRLQVLSENIPEDIKAEISDARERLDILDKVDYEEVLATKLRIARKIFLLEKNDFLSSDKFRTFFEENKAWLRPYAAFCLLKDLFGTADHTQWGVLSKFSSEKLDHLCSERGDHYSAIAFRYYMQYHLHLQLSEAAEYARDNRVVLKGDLPIGVDKKSVDTWVYPSLFRMNKSTGAPPDYFDANGQNWGFPTYNWEEMAKDNYSWWRARLSQMAKYFSAYRIDHILGFFRIWELPDHAVSGIMGRFRPCLPVTQEEMEREGLWDFDRMSQPYVKTHLLQSIFGRRWSEVASKYFIEHTPMAYRFRPEYDTEKKVVEALKVREDSPSWLRQEAEETQSGLFTLLQNQVLIRDPENPRWYYPRFDMESTSSFDELDDHSKGVMKRLYTDFFYHRQETLWRENALKTLPVMMNSSDMLTCGEDLGMIPHCVPPVLGELGLLALRIQRMPIIPGQEFGNPAEYDYMTVCAPSCHDTSTMRAWWEEVADRRQNFFRTFGYAADPPDICDPNIAHAIIQQHMESPSVWAIFPLQDLLALKEEYTQRPAKEETINNPSVARHYWRYRVHIPMETLLSDHEFIGFIQGLVIGSHRASAMDLTENGYVPEHLAENGYVPEQLTGNGYVPEHVHSPMHSPPSLLSPFPSKRNENGVALINGQLKELEMID
eukprot:TRINITY_DN368_c0_g3_i1.p1 TRINITY_DN368_c0_g3~~TRINITY_DN368_c0_g3_i1.p1  ORF type:complete len:703 (+),score=133.78 TRINITY_DN368_c0_g3_i1:1-2109(+)